jgi:hypothetical protein
MSTLRFSDGEVFNTCGPVRAEQRKDGWYVMGKGMLIPVDNMAEAIKLVCEHKAKALVAERKKKEDDTSEA